MSIQEFAQLDVRYKAQTDCIKGIFQVKYKLKDSFTKNGNRHHYTQSRHSKYQTFFKSSTKPAFPPIKSPLSENFHTSKIPQRHCNLYFI